MEEKKSMFYQQSFRIDDLLTARKVVDQQPDHFSTTLSSPLGGTIEENGAIAGAIGFRAVQHGDSKVYG